MAMYFRMSNRFSKSTPQDFGLMQAEDGKLAIDPNDGTLWERCSLYDFGWGKENGYFKCPLPNYDELLSVILTSKDSDDIYGAAAIILDRYPEELLDSCEKIFSAGGLFQEVQTLDKVFNLNSGTNLCPIVGKNWNEIQRDARRWQAIADAAKCAVSMYTKRAKPFWKN